MSQSPADVIVDFMWNTYSIGVRHWDITYRPQLMEQVRRARAIAGVIQGTWGENLLRRASERKLFELERDPEFKIFLESGANLIDAWTEAWNFDRKP